MAGRRIYAMTVAGKACASMDGGNIPALSARVAQYVRMESKSIRARTVEELGFAHMIG